MQLNNYIYVAAAVVLLALVLSVGNLLRGARKPDLSQQTQTVELGDEQVGVLLEGDVLDPLVTRFAGARSINPFNLQEELAGREMQLPLPPPPPLTPPTVPMLPLEGEWGDR